MPSEQSLEAPIFDISHNFVLNNRNSWSYISSDNVCYTSIWDNGIYGCNDGEIFYNNPQSRQVHVNNISQSINENIPIVGVLKNRNPGGDQYLCSNYYFICEPLAEKNNTIFRLIPCDGDIRNFKHITSQHTDSSADGRSKITEQRFLSATSLAERVMAYRHGILQNRLFTLLKWGCITNCGPELEYEINYPNRRDIVRRIDAVFFEFERITAIYEVKVGESAGDCIRAAVGQLLEYSGVTGVKNLVVVGEHAIDSHGTALLELLKQSVSSDLRISYMNV